MADVVSALVEFIQARLADRERQLEVDERLARAASGGTVVGEPGNWQPAPGGDEWEACRSEDGDEELLVALRPGLPRPPGDRDGLWGAVFSNEDDPCDRDAWSPMPHFEHAANWDPKRVLADVAEGRRDVEAVRGLISEILRYEYRIDGEWGCSCPLEVIATGRCPETPLNRIPALRLIAQRWAGHRDYREEWKPE